MSENIKTDLILKLKEIFRSDRSDLDFGIYRILNFRRKEIERFIEEDLVKQAESEFSELVKANFEEQKAELDALKEEINRDFGEGTIDERDEVRRLHDAPKIKSYIELKQSIDDQRQVQTQINEVFNYVYEFFSRYYDKGDFISQRRFGGREKYVIPHNGEEVSLYWVNQDQHYIKTSEDYRKYSFNLDDYNVTFKLVDAESEKNNNVGADSFFVIHRELPVSFDKENKQLEVFFEHRPLMEEDLDFYGLAKSSQQNTKFGTIIEKDYELILDSIRDFPDLTTKIKSGKHNDGGNPELKHHLIQYYQKNDMDYFIHKNLGEFLRRELDFYIKNEVLDLDETISKDTKNLKLMQLKIGAIKKISEQIITFLDQIENFQKKLFEKKKFVITTDYCITLDLIDKRYYPEILKNNEQMEEWKKLYNFDVKESVKKLKGTLIGHTGGIEKIEVLADKPTLMIDTKFFDLNFKLKLLENVQISDKKINGVLIKSENFHALNLIRAKYEKKIKCVHIDPPYNTATSGFLYKNNYQHSSWLSMMIDRIKLGIELLKPEGSFLCHIDENEYEKLHFIFEKFSVPNAGTIVWDKRNPVNAGRGVATRHEYIICRSGLNEPIYLENTNVKSMLDAVAEIIKKNGGITEKARKEYAKWVSTNDQLSGGEKAYRYIDDEGRVYQSVSLRAPEPRSDPKFFKPLIHPITMKPCAVPPNGFSRTPETLNEMVKNGEILFGPDETTQPRQKVLLTKEKQRQLSSVIQDAHKGKADLSSLGLDFPYCHPISIYQELVGAIAKDPDDIVLDYFAGSGTTAHAVINLNGQNNGNRKYILIEMGEYFDSIIKPRLQKIVYSKKGQRDLSESDGNSHIFKYMYLEQYEDTLNNLLFSDKGGVQTTLHKLPDYFLQHVLDVETRDSPTRLTVDKFKTPFDYKIKTLQGREEKTEPVDLVETFNYLLGIKVKKIRQYENEQTKYIMVYGEKGEEPACTKVLIIWRNYDETILEKEKPFIEQKIIPQFNPDTIYINVDSLIKGAESIEPKFKELMGA
jgi:adenine-specific DNA-methyltransferase